MRNFACTFLDRLCEPGLLTSVEQLICEIEDLDTCGKWTMVCYPDDTGWILEGGIVGSIDIGCARGKTHCFMLHLGCLWYLVKENGWKEEHP